MIQVNFFFLNAKPINENIHKSSKLVSSISHSINSDTSQPTRLYFYTISWHFDQGLILILPL